MRQLFFYGGGADNFEATSRPFIDAAGGSAARIALLCPKGDPGWDRWLPIYQGPWGRMGAEILPVHPIPGTTELAPEMLERIRAATGIFMCGGDTRVYRQVYVCSEAGALIRERYQAGIPYAGLSAGALLAPDTGSIWGDKLTTVTNTLVLRGSEDGCAEELHLNSGLGLMHDIITEAHFSEYGGFSRLVAAMELTSVTHGLGFDEPICVEIRNEREGLVHGRGRAYWLRRAGNRALEVTVLDPGQAFSLT